MLQSQLAETSKRGSRVVQRRWQAGQDNAIWRDGCRSDELHEGSLKHSHRRYKNPRRSIEPQSVTQAVSLRRKLTVCVTSDPERQELEGFTFIDREDLMKTWKLDVIVAMLLLVICSAVALAQTQAATNQEACDEYTKADDELNTIYQKVLREHTADALFLRKMRTAQRAWVAYRDAYLAALYPAADARSEYGSAYPMCRCAALAELTRKRTEELRRRTDGAPEGDVCAGSTRKTSRGDASSGVPEHERLDSVFRKRWTLTQMGERSFTGAEPYLEFDVKQGRFSGSSGCNRIFGGYHVDGTDLKFTAVASTKRACLDAGAQQVEASFLKALETTNRVEIQGDVIRLYATGSPILRFRASGREPGPVTK